MGTVTKTFEQTTACCLGVGIFDDGMILLSVICFLYIYVFCVCVFFVCTSATPLTPPPSPSQTRVAAAQQRVNDLLDLKSCAEGVQTALQAEDFEQAAAHVHRFLAIDESVVRLSEAGEAAAGRSGDSLSSAFALLHTAEVELHAAVGARFDEAVKAEDLASIERFFKIFPLLNRHDEGVRRFAEYLCRKVSVEGLIPGYVWRWGTGSEW